jgi:hypothetical protein
MLPKNFQSKLKLLPVKAEAHQNNREKIEFPAHAE